MDTGENIVSDSIPVAQDTETITVDLQGSCHNFWLRAYNGSNESLNSAIAVACAKDADPPPATQVNTVGGFTISNQFLGIVAFLATGNAGGNIIDTFKSKKDVQAPKNSVL